MTDDNIIIKRIWHDKEDIRVCLWNMFKNIEEDDNVIFRRYIIRNRGKRDMVI